MSEREGVFNHPKWKLPENAAELADLGRKFDAGPDPLVNGHMWTDMNKFRDGDHYHLSVEYRGPKAWTIANHSCSLNRNGEWEYEPYPSNRTDEFIERTRYGSPREALEIANHFRNRVTLWSEVVQEEKLVRDPCGQLIYDYSAWDGSEDHRIFKAIALAYAAHRDYPNGGYRKFEQVPYIMHPQTVANQTEAWARRNRQPDRVRLVSAAWLHDVVEDCPSSFIEDIRQLDPAVLALVMELTNPSKSSSLSRAARKQMDRDHLAHVSPEAKVIKLIDRRANLMEIADQPADPNFKLMYANESELLLEALRSPETKELEEELSVWIKHIQNSMKIRYPE